MVTCADQSESEGRTYDSLRESVRFAAQTDTWLALRASEEPYACLVDVPPLRQAHQPQ